MTTSRPGTDAQAGPDDARRPAVVYLTADWPWPPTSGGRLQAVHLAEALRDHHDVTVLAADRTDDRFPEWSRAVEAIRGRRASQRLRASDVLRGIPAGRQVLLQRMLAAGAHEALGAVLDRTGPDLVVLGRPFFDGFVDAVTARRIPLAIEANEDLLRASRSIVRHGATMRSRLVAGVDCLVVGRMQRRNYPRADRVLVCSPIEASVLRRATGVTQLRVVPNVVPAVPSPPPIGEITELAFLGSYRYAPNEAAAIELIEEVLPRVAALGGPDRAALIGRDPTPRMHRAAAAHPGVRISGEVPDVLAELAAAGLLVVPLRSGAGTRVKILEAAAAGIPIVSTPFGLEGLALRDGVEVLAATTPDAIAAAVMRLHRDPELRRRIAEAGRRAVTRTYSIEAGRAAVAAALETLTGAAERTAGDAERTAGAAAASRLAMESPEGIDRA